jgi:hypothetical protein
MIPILATSRQSPTFVRGMAFLVANHGATAFPVSGVELRASVEQLPPNMGLSTRLPFLICMFYLFVLYY